MQSKDKTRRFGCGQDTLAAVVFLCAILPGAFAQRHAFTASHSALAGPALTAQERPSPAQPRGEQPYPNQPRQLVPDRIGPSQVQRSPQPYPGQNGSPLNEGYGPSRPNRGRAGVNPQQHLGEWMNAHSNQPLDQQQRALEQEPGFHQLRPEVQQHMRERLTQLNRMSPERRQQAIQRTEAMERMVPQQRVQVRNALGELGSLPPERQRAVVRAFGAVRDLPETQRQMYLNSPQIRGQFNDQERDTINNLVRVTPAAAGAGLPGFAPHPNFQPPYPPPQF